MTTLLITGILLVLFVEPLRRAFLGNGAWRLTLPLLVGALIGYAYAANAVSHGGPGWLMFACPAFGAGCLGGVLWTCLNDILPRDPRR